MSRPSAPLRHLERRRRQQAAVAGTTSPASIETTSPGKAPRPGSGRARRPDPRPDDHHLLSAATASAAFPSWRSEHALKALGRAGRGRCRAPSAGRGCRSPRRAGRSASGRGTGARTRASAARPRTRRTRSGRTARADAPPRRAQGRHGCRRPVHWRRPRPALRTTSCLLSLPGVLVQPSPCRLLT
jgi:hypothetical protein